MCFSSLRLHDGLSLHVPAHAVGRADPVEVGSDLLRGTRIRKALHALFPLRPVQAQVDRQELQLSTPAVQD